MVKIKDKLIGPGQPTFVIAEIGINHNGDIDKAKKLIDMAVFTVHTSVIGQNTAFHTLSKQYLPIFTRRKKK